MYSCLLSCYTGGGAIFFQLHCDKHKRHGKEIAFFIRYKEKESSLKDSSDTETVLTREAEELPSVETLGSQRLPEIRAFFSIFCGLLKSSQQIPREMKIAD